MGGEFIGGHLAGYRSGILLILGCIVGFGVMVSGGRDGQTGLTNQRAELLHAYIPRHLLSS